MRIRLAVPSGLNQDETEAALDAALEAVTASSTPLVARGRVPTFAQALKAGRVRWRPEPPGDEHFDLPTTVIGRGWGDCDDLAPWHAASLRATGRDPEARAVVYPSGPGKWHAVVQRHNGKIEDPSKAAGMGSVGADDYGGALWPAMFSDPRLALAALPWAGGWGGRVDVPSLSVPAAYSALSHARSPAQAMRAALNGACVVGEDDIDELSDLRMRGLHDLLSGATSDELDEALGEVGFFGLASSLLPAAASLASPILSKFGLGPKGAPAAAPSGGGGGGGGYPMGPGTTMTMPGGPIIVRF